MGGSLSVNLAGIHMIRMETDVVVPLRPIFYERYVHVIYNRGYKNTVDKLYDGLTLFRMDLLGAAQEWGRRQKGPPR